MLDCSLISGDSLSTYAKFSGKCASLGVRNVSFPENVRLWGLEMLAFRKILRTYLMDLIYSLKLIRICDVFLFAIYN